jgi:hypothetical protein
MALVKVSARVNGRCKRGSRHVKNRKGCYRSSMGGKKRK